MTTFFAWVGVLIATFYGLQFLAAGVCMWLFDSKVGTFFVLFGAALLSIAWYGAPFTISFATT